MDEREARRECMIIHERERDAIRREDWGYYWMAHRDRITIVQAYFPHLFFSQRGATNAQ